MPLLVFLLLCLIGCQTVSPSEPVVVVPEQGFVDIRVFICATQPELAHGGAELWGPNWHYVEILIECTEA